MKKKIIIIGSGTGGHIFPGIEIAKHLMQYDWNVRWLGNLNRMEYKIVPMNGIEIDCLNFSNFNSKSLKNFFQSSMKIFFAWRQAFIFIKSFRPNIVLGMGGAVSGIGCLAAWNQKIPLIIHEQNKVAGLSNRIISKIASKKLQAFPKVFQNAETVGNPIRENILKLSIPEIRLRGRIGPIRILVLGGSQGSWVLNKVLPKLAKHLKNRINIWHQTGIIEKNKVLQNYKKIGYQCYKINAFINNIDKAYNWADMIICRSGALTVSEIIAVGLPAIFIPYEHKDCQQYKNALILKKINAAEIFNQKKFTVENLIKILKLWDRNKLKEMSEKARSIFIKHSTEKIVNSINTLTKK